MIILITYNLHYITFVFCAIDLYIYYSYPLHQEVPKKYQFPTLFMFNLDDHDSHRTGGDSICPLSRENDDALKSALAFVICRRRNELRLVGRSASASSKNILPWSNRCVKSNVPDEIVDCRKALNKDFSGKGAIAPPDAFGGKTTSAQTKEESNYQQRQKETMVNQSLNLDNKPNDQIKVQLEQGKQNLKKRRFYELEDTNVGASLQRSKVDVDASRNRSTVLFLDGLLSNSNLGNINKGIIRYNNNNTQILEEESKESMVIKSCRKQTPNSTRKMEEHIVIMIRVAISTAIPLYRKCSSILSNKESTSNDGKKGQVNNVTFQDNNDIHVNAYDQNQNKQTNVSISSSYSNVKNNAGFVHHEKYDTAHNHSHDNHYEGEDYTKSKSDAQVKKRHSVSHQNSGTIVTDTTDNMNDTAKSISNKYLHSSASTLVYDYHSASLHKYPSSSLAKNYNNKDNCSQHVVESETSYKILDGIVHHIVSTLQSLQQHLSEKEKESYSNGNNSCISDDGYSEQSEKIEVDHHDGDTTVQNEDRTRDVNVTSLNENILQKYFFTPLLLNATTKGDINTESSFDFPFNNKFNQIEIIMALCTVLHRIVFLDTSNLTTRSGTGIGSIIIQLLCKLLRSLYDGDSQHGYQPLKITTNQLNRESIINLPDVLTVNCLRLLESIIALRLQRCYSQSQTKPLPYQRKTYPFYSHQCQRSNNSHNWKKIQAQIVEQMAEDTLSQMKANLGENLVVPVSFKSMASFYQRDCLEKRKSSYHQNKGQGGHANEACGSFMPNNIGQNGGEMQEIMKPRWENKVNNKDIGMKKVFDTKTMVQYLDTGSKLMLRLCLYDIIQKLSLSHLS